MLKNENMEVLGERIRQIRKERQMTLKELADGICSLGKMSNIENGKTTPTSYELSSFASKLKIPEEKLNPHSLTSQKDFDNKKWIRRIENIEGLLSLGLNVEGKKKIDELNKSAEGIEELFFTKKFLLAYYYKVIGDNVSSVSILLRLIKEIPLNSTDSLIQIRAKNMLCAICIKNNELEKAGYVLKEIADEVFVKNRYPTEHWKVKFNLSVFLILKGDYDLARLHAESLSHEKDLEYISNYLLIIIDYVNNDLLRAVDRAYLIKKHTKELGSNELLLRVTLLEYFSQFMFVDSGANSISTKTVSELLDLILELKHKHPNFSVYCLNLLLSLSFKRKYLYEVRKIKHNLLILLQDKVDKPLRAQSYLYMSKICVVIEEDKETALTYINKGLDLVPNKDSTLYAALLYEKCKLEEVKLNPLYKKVLDAFVNAEEYKMDLNFNLSYLLPDLYY